jgi:hypothetical protein
LAGHLLLHIHNAGHLTQDRLEDDPIARKKGETDMNIFYIIGVIVVVIFILGVLGLR